MSLRTLLAQLRAVLFKDRSGHLEEELNAHAELLAADYIARGMTPAEAHSAARRELGNVTFLRESYREQNGLPVLENIARDLMFAVRTLRRNLAFTSSCIATLAIGVGSVATVLCLVSALVWRPLPYPEPERLVVLNEVDPHHGVWPFSEPALLDLQERSRSLKAVAGYRRADLALTGVGDSEMIRASAVTPSFFALFAITPIAGATFHEGEKAIVIGRELWKRKWQAAEDAVGKQVMLGGESYTIAGIADLPLELFPGTELVFPLAPSPTESRTAHETGVIARLSPGVDEPQAQAELTMIAASLSREGPQSNRGWSMRAISLTDSVLGPRTGKTLWMIFGAVALLWLLACANVAGLQLARAIARTHEMNIRRALGAGRGRLLAQALSESFVLASAGTLLGLSLAQSAVRVIRTFGVSSFPRLAAAQIDTRVTEVTLAFVLVSAFLFTVLSARSAGLQTGRELARRDPGRDVLIVAQVALASILLLGAGLLFHSFLRLQQVNPGFDPEKVLEVRVSLPGGTYDTSRRISFFRDLTSRLERLPEVERAAATNVAPFSGDGTANRFRLEGDAAASEFRVAAWRAVTPGFFTTLGVPLRRGRLFTAADTEDSAPVVILSESMARKFWPNQDPLGKRLLWGKSGSPKTIVGIVGDLRDMAVDTAPVPVMFRPFPQLSDAPMTLVIRTRTDPVAAVAGVRGEIGALDRNVAADFEPLPRAMSDSILQPKAGLLSIAAFAFIAIVTAAFGLYGLISYRVNQRQQEIGVRLALGAPPASVRWNVQKRCLGLVCAGLVIGLPSAYGLSTLMTSLLYETQPAEAGAYLAVLVVFAVVALTASYGPANRAAKMEPAAAIRHE